MRPVLAAVGGALAVVIAYGLPWALVIADEVGPYWWRQMRGRRRARRRERRSA